ncbi:ABC-2 type transport system ATP-binding protein [Paraoerskovia marina]|uniref:ABC-2 type transport system ATP-binding protein n=1 Tax=Paraoerskovia marina TaxID=545619 RepID=A0A1H1PLP8_9CELL|nr:ABC transporter ATP-binding protein [Paraoerskovia marina]SDS12212.1 ABC-2 type transport system ATP-binding protein [Paraoerskovia marina]
MSTTDTPVEIHDLVKTFGTVRALDGFSMTVRRGEVAGFLGPNGAGKSTTIRVLLGLIKADGGSARLLGGDPWADAVDLHRRLAYVPGDVNLWPNLSGGEAIDLLTRLRGPVDPGRRADLLERFELDPSKKARTYSKGNRQKVALVAALAADTELLILDEPTSGLDPLMESVFTDCVREATDRGASVLLSSHILGEVEKLCDTVTIIRAGKDVQSGTLDDLRHLTRSTYTADVTGDPEELTALDAVHDLTVSPVGDGRAVTVSFSADNDRTDEVVAALSGLGLRRLVTAPPSLEEMFLRHYGDDVTGSRTVQG